jgi:hypothetical protein
MTQATPAPRKLRRSADAVTNCVRCLRPLTITDEDVLCGDCEFGLEAARGDFGVEAQQLVRQAPNLYALLGVTALDISEAAFDLAEAAEGSAYQLLDIPFYATYQYHDLIVDGQLVDVDRVRVG